MTRTSSIPTKAASGFTLIELLVVLGIMSLLAAVFVTQLNRSPNGPGKRQKIAQILDILAGARLEALESGQAVPVKVDVLPGGFTLEAGEGEGADAPLKALLFYPDGSSSGGRVAAGGRPRIIVDWFSGYAHEPS